MGIIRLNNIKVFAHHGCMNEEAIIGGHYLVDVILHTDFSKAAQNDTLEDTIDYVVVNRIVAEEMAIRSKLIEHVGQRMVVRMKESFPSLEKVEVCLTKIAPPINGDVESVSISIVA